MNLVVVVSGLLVTVSLCQGLSQPNIRVRVCQNKDCCQRFEGKAQNLVQTIQHLVPPSVEVESSGCLSQCGKGPNICIQSSGKEQTFNGVTDATSAGAVLELADDQLVIHPTLMAAAKVMERAAKGKKRLSKGFIF